MEDEMSGFTVDQCLVWNALGSCETTATTAEIADLVELSTDNVKHVLKVLATRKMILQHTAPHPHRWERNPDAPKELAAKIELASRIWDSMHHHMNTGAVLDPEEVGEQYRATATRWLEPPPHLRLEHRGITGSVAEMRARQGL
jgi:hypothetical protein